MLIIDKDTVNATKQKLDNVGQTQEVIDDVTRMLEIKQTLLWRSDAIAPCCGSLCSLTSQLTHEVDILENTLSALENGDRPQAAELLEQFAHIVEQSGEREPSQPNYC